MRVKYSPEADVLLIELKEGKLADSQDIAEGIIVHYTEDKQPLEIEILDASKVVELSDISLHQVMQPTPLKKS
jgi:uncharacterized protein YuzE